MADPELRLEARLVGGPGPARLHVTWHNPGPHALLLLPRVDSDAGPQFDSLRLADGSGAEHPLISLRKNAMPRWCTLAAAASYSVDLPLDDWLARLHLQPNAAWRIGYRIGSKTALPAAPACGDAAGLAQDVPAQPWRGAIWSQVFGG